MKKLKLIKLVTCFFITVSCFIFAQTTSNTWWNVYFTNPGGTSKTALTKITPEKALVQLIQTTQESFYAAFYDLSSVPVVKALISAKKRGVDIRIVTDDSNYNNAVISEIQTNGIPVISDGRKGLMHNKFAIIDGKILWTGSYNVTSNGENRNNNNAIAIHSSELADIYYAEFSEMFDLGVFGNKKEPGVFGGISKKYYVKIDETNINAYFAPDDNVENIIIDRIKKAKSSIHFMAFSFTSDGIGEAMIDMFHKGVKVTGLFERQGAKSKDSEFTKMKVEGIPVRLDSNKYAMHHKVIIIDDYRLITGSYNFSKNASQRNDENCLMIDNAEITALYIKEFEKLYKTGKTQ